MKHVVKRLALCIAAGSLLLAAGCGSDGKNGVDGKDGVDAGNNVRVSSLSAEDWSNLELSSANSQITGVTINSPPVVRFTVKTADGRGVTGLADNYTKKDGDKLGTYNNLGFTIAKLVPGTNGSPSKWVNYIVTAVSTTTGAVTDGAKPSTENIGTLVDNGGGSYTYTFYRDITKIKDQVAALTDSGFKKKADLGDLTYNANLTHRVVVQIGGNAIGTTTAANNPINLVYDFIPATGKAVTAADSQRDIATIESCQSCHTKFVGLHVANRGTATADKETGLRQDPRFCVTCHTDQRKWSVDPASSYYMDGAFLGDFLNLVHKVHMGEDLTKTGYNYAGVQFNHTTYPQPIQNCAKCHTKSEAAPQGDNWTTVPSRLACGSCHDGINWSTGAGHVGGSATSDANCVLCHSAASIKSVYHVTITPPDNGVLSRIGHNNLPVNVAAMLNPPAGVYKIGFQIKQVTVGGAAGAKKATVVYRILKDGQPVKLNATGNLIDNVEGTPSIYVAYAVAQDGVATPADWTTNFNATVLNIRNAAAGNSQTGPDTDGYYTATLATVIPDAAKMVTAALGINYDGLVQMNIPAYPNGVRLREPAFPIRTADGYTARRTIVNNDRCNDCHGQLGVFTGKSFHNGARNNGEGCAICHSTGTGTGSSNATGHVGAANLYGGGWSISAKDLVHSIHASGKRSWPYSYEATTDNPGGFQSVTYPAVLKNCEACHVAGSYDFSKADSVTALPNLLWSTVAKADMTIPAGYNGTVLGLSHWMEQYVYPKGTAADFSASRANNLVISPITAACAGCHDSSSAVAHMKQNGGKFYEAFGANATSGANPEACMTCHGSGKVGDIKKAHKY